MYKYISIAVLTVLRVASLMTTCTVIGALAARLVDRLS